MVCGSGRPRSCHSTRHVVTMCVLWFCRPCHLDPTPEHRGFGSGYVNIPHSVHEECVYFVLESLAEQGFNTIVVWRGCGEHRLEEAVDRFNAKFRLSCVVHLPPLPYHDIWCRVADPSVLGGHADSFTTSIALHRRPNTVRLDRIPSTSSREVDWNDPHLDFTKYSDTGVIGDGEPSESPSWGAGFGKRSYRPRQRYSEIVTRI